MVGGPSLARLGGLRERREVDAVGEQQDLRAHLARPLGEQAAGGADQVRLADQPRLHRLDPGRHAGEADVEVDPVVDQGDVETAGRARGRARPRRGAAPAPSAAARGAGPRGWSRSAAPPCAGRAARGRGRGRPGDAHAEHVQPPLGVEDVAGGEEPAAQEAVDVEHRMAGARQRQRQVLRTLEAVAPGDRRQIEDRRPGSAGRSASASAPSRFPGWARRRPRRRARPQCRGRSAPRQPRPPDAELRASPRAPERSTWPAAVRARSC